MFGTCSTHCTKEFGENEPKLKRKPKAKRSPPPPLRPRSTAWRTDNGSICSSGKVLFDPPAEPSELLKR